MRPNVFTRLCAAQQEAQRAQFYVEKAKQDQRQKIIQAEGEAQAAKMVNFMSLHLSHGFILFWSVLLLSVVFFFISACLSGCLSGSPLLSHSPSHLYAFFHGNVTFAELHQLLYTVSQNKLAVNLCVWKEPESHGPLQQEPFQLLSIYCFSSSKTKWCLSPCLPPAGWGRHKKPRLFETQEDPCSTEHSKNGKNVERDNFILQHHSFLASNAKRTGFFFPLRRSTNLSDRMSLNPRWRSPRTKCTWVPTAWFWTCRTERVSSESNTVDPDHMRSRSKMSVEKCFWSARCIFRTDYIICNGC